MIQTALLATLACLAGHAVTVIALLHARIRLAPVLLHAVSALAWHCAGIAILLKLGAIHYYWHSAALFGLGVMLFVFGFSAVYKSVTLRTLIFVAQRPETTATVQDIRQHVVMRSFSERAGLLIESGMTSLGPDGYSLTKRGRQIAQRILVTRGLLGVGSAGLYFEQVPNRRPK